MMKMEFDKESAGDTVRVISKITDLGIEFDGSRLCLAGDVGITQATMLHNEIKKLVYKACFFDDFLDGYKDCVKPKPKYRPYKDAQEYVNSKHFGKDVANLGCMQLFKAVCACGIYVKNALGKEYLIEWLGLCDLCTIDGEPVGVQE